MHAYIFLLWKSDRSGNAADTMFWRCYPHIPKEPRGMNMCSSASFKSKNAAFTLVVCCGDIHMWLSRGTRYREQDYPRGFGLPANWWSCSPHSDFITQTRGTWPPLADSWSVILTNSQTNWPQRLNFSAEMSPGKVQTSCPLPRWFSQTNRLLHSSSFLGRRDEIIPLRWSTMEHLYELRDRLATEWNPDTR